MALTISFSATKIEDILAVLTRLSGGVPLDEVNHAIEELSAMSDSMRAKFQAELDELNATVAEVATVNGSLKELLAGIPALIQRAVDEALASGATPEQLASLDAMNAALRAQVGEMAAAVTQGTAVEDSEGGEGTDTTPGGDTGPDGDDTASGGADTVEGAEPTGETPNGDTVTGG